MKIAVLFSLVVLVNQPLNAVCTRSCTNVENLKVNVYFCEGRTKVSRVLLVFGAKY